MIWLSILLVFGTLALIGVNLTSQSPELHLGAGLIIRGHIPWILLAVLWGGVALGVASLSRGRTLPKLGVLLLEIAPVAFVSWYVILGSVLPAHVLAIGWAIRSRLRPPDQDETLHERAVPRGDRRPSTSSTAVTGDPSVGSSWFSSKITTSGSRTREWNSSR
jgi:hypothetical protein